MASSHDRGPKTAGTPESDALRLIKTASESVTVIKRLGDVGLNKRADVVLRAAVDTARAAGAGWGVIGFTLGIARGNAYQRYRKPPA